MHPYYILLLFVQANEEEEKAEQDTDTEVNSGDSSVESSDQISIFQELRSNNIAIQEEITQVTTSWSTTEPIQWSRLRLAYSFEYYYTKQQVGAIHSRTSENISSPILTSSSAESTGITTEE